MIEDGVIKSMERFHHSHSKEKSGLKKYFN
jgi:hypothetical protein